MNRTQKKTLVLLLGILVGLGILLAVVSAVKRSSAQREAEEAAAQDAASVITETEAAYSSLTYDNGSATLSFHLDEAGKWVWSDDPEFPLDDSTIQSILTLLTNLKPQQTITEGDTLEAYGLDQPFAHPDRSQAGRRDANHLPGQHHYGRQQLLYADERTGESGVYHLQLPVHRDVQDHL